MKTKLPSWLITFLGVSGLFVLLMVFLFITGQVKEGNPWLALSYLMLGGSNLTLAWHLHKASKRKSNA